MELARPSPGATPGRSTRDSEAAEGMTALLVLDGVRMSSRVSLSGEVLEHLEQRGGLGVRDATSVPGRPPPTPVSHGW